MCLYHHKPDFLFLSFFHFFFLILFNAYLHSLLVLLSVRPESVFIQLPHIRLACYKNPKLVVGHVVNLKRLSQSHFIHGERRGDNTDA